MAGTHKQLLNLDRGLRMLVYSRLVCFMGIDSSESSRPRLRCYRAREYVGCCEPGAASSIFKQGCYRDAATAVLCIGMLKHSAWTGHCGL
jgi:hypothetical protein